MIACDNDVDDSLKLPDFDSNDTNVVIINDGENPHANNHNENNFISGENQNKNNDIINAVVPHGNQLTQNGLLYSNFKNNWEMIAQKLDQLDLLGDLVIRAIIFKKRSAF